MYIRIQNASEHNLKGIDVEFGDGLTVVTGVSGSGKTSLVFDTGAGNIVLHENVARELGIDGGQASQGEGVDGIKIPIRSARLNYVRVGPYKKENLRVDIVSYDGEADDDYNGLLGMNFIRGLKYNIDFNAQVIKWNP